MLLGIDHLVIVVADLKAAAADYSSLGFTVVPGGRHPIGSENALIAFADGSYIELIAFDDAANHPWKNTLQTGGGLADFCMATDDLTADRQRFCDAAVAMTEPYSLTRVRPDGYRLEWLLSVPQDHNGVVPFLIKDITPREERVPRQNAHENRTSGISTVTIATRDLAFVRSCYGETGAATSLGEIHRHDLGGHGAAYRIGLHTLEFVSPDDSSGPLTSLVVSRGSAPFSAALAAHRASPASLDLSKTHQARLSFVNV